MPNNVPRGRLIAILCIVQNISAIGAASIHCACKLRGSSRTGVRIADLRAGRQLPGTLGKRPDVAEGACSRTAASG